jgi:ankyrin repeat protein
MNIVELAEGKLWDLLYIKLVNIKYQRETPPSDEELDTVLLIATKTQESAKTILLLLIDLVKKITARDDSGFTAIHWAVYHKDVDLISRLMLPDHVDLKDFFDETSGSLQFALEQALRLSSDEREWEPVYALVDGLTNKFCPSQIKPYHDILNPIFRKIFFHWPSTKLVEILFKLGLNVNLLDSPGQFSGGTAFYLSLAIDRQHWEIARKLLFVGASSLFLSSEHYTKLQEHIQLCSLPSGGSATITKLVEHELLGALTTRLRGRKMDTNDEINKALLIAVQKKQYSIASLLVQAGATIAARDDQQWTALHWAVSHGQLGYSFITEVMVPACVKLEDFFDEVDGKTAALQFALDRALRGDKMAWASVSILWNGLTQFPQAEIQRYHEILNPIFLKSFWCQPSVGLLSTLLKLGLNVNFTKEGAQTSPSVGGNATYLGWAIGQGAENRWGIITNLLLAGAFVPPEYVEKLAAHQKAVTEMMFDSARNRKTCLEIMRLLDEGAQITARDENGWTLIHWAVLYNNDELINQCMTSRYFDLKEFFDHTDGKKSVFQFALDRALDTGGKEAKWESVCALLNGLTRFDKALIRRYFDQLQPIFPCIFATMKSCAVVTAALENLGLEAKFADFGQYRSPQP